MDKLRFDGAIACLSQIKTSIFSHARCSRRAFDLYYQGIPLQ